MLHIALVCEGKTDKPVLKNILKSFFDLDHDIKVPELQPVDPIYNDPDPLVGHGDEHGGWPILKKYLGTKEFREALDVYDYVIVQVDTDVCELSGFDCPRGSFLNNYIGDFYSIVEGKIQGWIDKEEVGTFIKYREKIILAICMHSIEYWILINNYPLDVGSKDNCFDIINKRLGDDKRKLLSKSGRSDTYKDYSSSFSDINVLIGMIGKSFSLDAFVMQIGMIKHKI